MVTLSLGVLVAKAFSSSSLHLPLLLPKLGKGGRGGGLLLALILFEYLPSPYPMSPPDTPPFYYRLAREPGDFAILNLPMNWDRPGYLLYQTVHGKRLATGYISRDDPRTLVERMPVLQHLRHLGDDIIVVDLPEVASSVFAYLGVRYVVLDFYKMPGGPERERTLALTRQAFGDTKPFYRDERLLVYKVEPPEPPAPFLILGRGWGERTEYHGSAVRPLESEASLVIHSPSPGSYRLEITAQAPVRGTLKVKKDGNLIAQYVFRTGEKAVVRILSISVEPGDTEVMLYWEPQEGSEPLRVLGIELQYACS